MSGLHRIALGVEYDGSTCFGWQRQSVLPTLQASFEAAISAIAGAPVAVTAAGRTDAGVHATGQVLHADVPVSRPLSAWVRGVNSLLPAQLAVVWAHPVPGEFHARFSATGRRYRYLLVNRPVRPALGHQRAGWHHRPLSLVAMRAAAAMLLGRHDFSAFRAAECQARTPVRDLRTLDIDRNGDLFTFSLAADAFLHHMVRNLVGALVAVGNDSRDPEWIAGVLAARDRRLAAPTFAAAGLYLVGVDYDARWDLPKFDSEPELLRPGQGMRR